MDLMLQDKIALISGASGGIGRVTTLALAREGAQTIMVARREDQLRELAGDVVAAGGRMPMIVVADLTDRDAFGRVREQVFARFPRMDILVNNLGQARPFTLETPDADWDEAFALNFTPPRKLAEVFLPSMKENGYGRIINLTSVLEPQHVSGSMTSKAAVLVWAKGLSRVVAKHGVTVNCISPGILMTEQIRNHYIPRVMPTKEDQERWLAHEIPAGRFGEPEDAAHMIAFLCSPLAGYITGQRICVDGGWNRHV
jgi:3-oxoacyl-[acyl-carrier protein] reductase